jgi:hypothetical protein
MPLIMYTCSRSEDVDLYKILIPKDSDWEIVSELGQFGVAAGKREVADGSAGRDAIKKSEVGE